MGPNGQRVHADAQAPGQLTSPLDLAAARASVVFDDQVTVIGWQSSQQSVETIEVLLLLIVDSRFDEHRSSYARFVESDQPALVARVFEQHKPRDGEAIARWRGHDDSPLLLERPRDARQRFIGQFVGEWALTSIEVRDQPPPNVEIGLTGRIDTVVQPFQQPIP
jgi:hypothetical protein